MTTSLQSETDIQNLGSDFIDRFLNSGAVFSISGGRCIVGLGESNRSNAARTDRFNVYSPDFLLEDAHPWRIFNDFAIVDAAALIEALPIEPTPELGWLDADREDFRQSFDSIQALIHSGELHKAVPVAYRRSSSPVGRGALARALTRSLTLSQNYALNAYGIWDENSGLLGITPERLFTLHADQTMTTMALAGTRTNEPGVPSLLRDPKEVREHAIVVEGISQRLSHIADYQIGPVSELVLNSLVHLHASISATPKTETSFEGWVRALHPTPAIGAWPLLEGMKWIQNDPHSRTRLRHGSPLGFIAPGLTESPCLVAIRGVEWTHEFAQITAGCGILAESLFEKEWVEVNSKMDSVQYGLRV